MLKPPLPFNKLGPKSVSALSTALRAIQTRLINHSKVKRSNLREKVLEPRHNLFQILMQYAESS